MIKLVNDTISHKDIDSLVDWLKTYPKLTMGDLTIQFEDKWSKWLGVKYSIFVNSGSSANLMMLYALKHELGIEKVVVPALSWATDLAPVMQLGLEPILVDCNLHDLSVDLDSLERVFIKEKPDVFILVSVLGLVPDMKRVVELCYEYGVTLLEDVCESYGSMHRGKKLGTYGSMSSFSFYFGHHMSTIEGGMISTNDEQMYHLLLMMRSHGWSRDLPEGERAMLRNDWDIDKFSERYTFYVPGFNLRGTEIQSFLGMRQLDRLDDIIEHRSDNFNFYRAGFNKKGFWVPSAHEDDFISNHAYPLLNGNKNEIVKRLKKAGIEARPLIAGSMGVQPFYIEVYGEQKLKNATRVDEEGFYVPNHPGLSIRDINKIINTII